MVPDEPFSLRLYDDDGRPNVIQNDTVCNSIVSLYLTHLSLVCPSPPSHSITLQRSATRIYSATSSEPSTPPTASAYRDNMEASKGSRPSPMTLVRISQTLRHPISTKSNNSTISWSTISSTRVMQVQPRS